MKVRSDPLILNFITILLLRFTYRLTDISGKHKTIPIPTA